MSLRTRLLVAFAAVVFIPIAMLALGLRQEMTARLSDQYERRLVEVVEIIDADLQRESAAIGERLVSLRRAILNDNRFRGGAVAGVEVEREYLLEYAGTALRLTGLSMLQIQDGDGRIISSGHFRNEHGRVEPGLAQALAGTKGGVALLTAHAPDGDFLALARGDSFRMGGRPFTLVGGIEVDEAFLGRLTRDRAIVVSLQYPGGGVSSAEAPPERESGIRTGDADVIRELRIPLIRSSAGASLEVVEARLLVTQPLTPLRALLRGVDAWFLATAAGTAVTALLLAVWVSSRISRPLAALAEQTAVLDLDRLDVQFVGGTDEVGTLSRVLGDLAERLRTSTARVRDAERRATVGDLARQVNHDIKNGLIPLRNVMRHLAQVERDDPGALASVFAERRQTVDSSIAYLETLASNYERLSTPPKGRDTDLNTVVQDVVRGVRGHGHVELRTTLAEDLPPVAGDPVALRRILENLITNAVDSLDSRPGRVTISTASIDGTGGPPIVRVTVADTGRGMSSDESMRIFHDFYTTKEGGTGLGLSIVRRLVVDLHGTLRVESEPGKGTRMIIDIPAAAHRRGSPPLPHVPRSDRTP
jgi:signal transduction histidine kinase